MHCVFDCVALYKTSEDLDTDTEFEATEDQTLETRSRCNIICSSFFLFLFCFHLLLFPNFVTYVSVLTFIFYLVNSIFLNAFYLFPFSERSYR